MAKTRRNDQHEDRPKAPETPAHKKRREFNHKLRHQFVQLTLEGDSFEDDFEIEVEQFEPIRKKR